MNKILGVVVTSMLLGNAGFSAEESSSGMLLAIGDSITAARIWQYRTGELLDLKVRSHCKGGIGVIGMVDGDGVAPPDYDPDDFGVKKLYRLSTSDVAGVSLVLMMGFYNEVGMIVDERKRGVVSDMYPKEDTFFGRLNYAIGRVRGALFDAKNEKAKIVLVSPHRYGRNRWVDRSAYETGEIWVTALSAVARHNRLPLIDLMDCCDIGRENWNVYQLSPSALEMRYLTSDGSPNVGTNCPFASISDAPDPVANKGRLVTVRGERGHYSSDGKAWRKQSGSFPWFADQLHLNADGYRRVGEAIAREIKAKGLAGCLGKNSGCRLMGK